jgi:hypothetical protein
MTGRFGKGDAAAINLPDSCQIKVEVWSQRVPSVGEFDRLSHLPENRLGLVEERHRSRQRERPQAGGPNHRVKLHELVGVLRIGSPRLQSREQGQSHYTS